jgi:hypothetical protein
MLGIFALKLRQIARFLRRKARNRLFFILTKMVQRGKV